MHSQAAEDLFGKVMMRHPPSLLRPSARYGGPPGEYSLLATQQQQQPPLQEGQGPLHHVVLHWRRVVDNLVVEALATVMVNMAAIVYGHHGFRRDNADGSAYFAEPWLQLVPALATGLVMLTCKNETFMPPDASMTVTLLLCAVGAYKSWLEVLARLVGHAFGLCITLLICWDMRTLTPQWHPEHRSPGVTFASEMIATTIEHVAVACLLMPLVRGAARHGPPNPTVLHAAFVFAVSHWVLRVTFVTEMNPSIVIAKAALADHQMRTVFSSNAGGGDHGDHAGINATSAVDYQVTNLNDMWHECLMAVWGQLVGLGLSVFYATVLCRHVEVKL